MLHATFFCAVYAGILIVPRTQWRVRTDAVCHCFPQARNQLCALASLCAFAPAYCMKGHARTS